ncbi:hypothetical protein LJ656_32010 [Paraburkholderia sp. MMS20-SJTR3]|uniref:Uncharacterized protein n=1 Tax=Paraburkholderia sejongensis TaxID=2886946 RepID=A0ABS8K4X0_9BURK|nr:hypothetical protein [Paraburkholderia sp. MMS20-SJTR3]MCC8397204.1 hypothetical protein [Paraburkholderia sp. MMS20-SJTR3]
MITARPCTAACVIDGRLVTLTFHPDNVVLRIADSSGACLRETRWHGTWRSLLDEFRGYYEAAGSSASAPGVEALVAQLGEPAGRAPREPALA